MGSPESARRLFAMSQPILGTIAESYLRKRGITALHDAAELRFHPRCYYRPDGDAPSETWPALIAAVTDLAGMITGAHRTWFDPSGHDKAPVDTPRRPWAISSERACGLEPSTTSWLPAKASKPCCRFAAPCQRCLWSLGKI